jgi:hypothetical protein
MTSLLGVWNGVSLMFSDFGAMRVAVLKFRVKGLRALRNFAPTCCGNISTNAADFFVSDNPVQLVLVYGVLVRCSCRFSPRLCSGC